MKFYGIRRGTLPQLIGLHNGDLLTAINGKSLAGLDQAMETYSSLRGAKRFEIIGERRGEPLRIVITIVDG